jgi:hypothetical protein
MQNWSYAAGVLVALTLLALLSKSAHSSVSGTNAATRKTIKALTKQSHHYFDIAAQNTNVLLQLLYTSKAVTAAKVVRKLAPEQEVNEIIGEDISEWIDDVSKWESKRLTQMGYRFPELQVASGVLVS